MVKNYVKYCSNLLIILVGILLAVFTMRNGIGYVAMARIPGAIPLSILAGFVGLAASALIVILGFERLNSKGKNEEN